MSGLPRPFSACLAAASALLLSLSAPAAAQGFGEALRQAEQTRIADSLKAAGQGASAPSGALPSAAPSGAGAVDSGGAAFLPKDSVPFTPRIHVFESPYGKAAPCPDALEHASLCWRGDGRLAKQDIGFPGARAWTLSLETLEPVPLTSPYFAGWKSNPYLNGGVLPPDAYAPRTLGGKPTALELPFAPVIPLDTPVTSLEWERGALALNSFHLQLRRMLGNHAYLGLDYYSATADSQTYDYQFNVHQPYLGGWAFLGKLYPPIDRDSGSLVLGGTSQGIEALNFRPRVGFWLDTNQVLEVFMDRLKNNSSLAWPRRPGAADSLGEADSLQALMASSFSAYTGGLVHGWSGYGWTSQWDASASALEKETPRGDTAGTSSPDAWDGSQFRLRGRVAAPGWDLGPVVDAEAWSESWEGDLFLRGRANGPAGAGWTDRQSLRLGLRAGGRDSLPFTVEAMGGLARSSRMDNSVEWLPQAGVEAAFDLPFGLAAAAGADFERREPDWELLYRHNPALFRFPSPGLKPRSDLGWRGEVTWTLPYLRLGAGGAFDRSAGAWLPGVLPSPEACGDLADSLYAYAGPCAGGKVPDSLALGLRNWDTLRRLSWHMLLGFDLGNWSLDLRNRFLLLSEAEDDAVEGVLADRTVPARVFKGDLGWKRDLLDGKLQVAVGWGWEWFSTRYAWVPDLRGGSQVRKLDEYLALDFGASMRIRTFLLSFKGMNFNHDRYATEPGVHPPGVNFRFGVDWTLLN